MAFFRDVPCSDRYTLGPPGTLSCRRTHPYCAQCSPMGFFCFIKTCCCWPLCSFHGDRARAGTLASEGPGPQGKSAPRGRWGSRRTEGRGRWAGNRSGVAQSRPVPGSDPRWRTRAFPSSPRNPAWDSLSLPEPALPMGPEGPHEMLSLVSTLAGPPHGAWAKSTVLRGSDGHLGQAPA